MCGIFAWWNDERVEDGTERTLRALSALVPRGPDEQHIWNDNNHTFLAHCRLKITGENGTQPLWNSERSVAALVNGQFYNHEVLRKNCEKDGYVFQTQTDSEVLLALYQQHGHACLEHLNGEFAFVLWDRTADTVWAVRDRTGIKPLRFACDGKSLAFASEAKALLAAGWKARWNTKALAQALTLQYPSPRSTLFEGIEQLAPGEFLIAQRHNGQWSTQRRRWFHWFAHDPATLRNEDTAYLPALQEAVNQRVDEQWGTAIHLSGGCDSTTILAMAAKCNNIHAFSVGFETDEDNPVAHDESALAEHTANTLGVPFSRVQVSRLAMCQRWEQAIEAAEGLAINGHLVAKWDLADTIHRRGFRVCMSGEGADESLLGYAFLTAQQGTNLNALQRDNPVSVGVMLPDTEQLDLSTIEQVWGFVPVWLHAKASLGWKVRTLLDDQWATQNVPSALESWAVDTSDVFSRNAVPVHQAAATWATVALGGYILPTLADAPEAAHRIQGRVPFLDQHVLEAATALSPQATGYPRETKHPVRRYLRQQGLDHIADRQKHPFQAPPLLGDVAVQAHLRELWSQPGVWNNTPFCPKKIKAWTDQWTHWDKQTCQKWEPVVSTVLSVYWMGRIFHL